ncbi:carbohydrate ABC transporter permease [Thalassobacillus sp. CUG 92003]|uniref:carbohydrate ABC transporter permease n=1 Tax=Thalassobacillus sp. CUG 92003 TaxID=2736641 RepID=UPI0015E64E80|nr:sugar ABC transporter permease [Thalassobacillus sp. CUG 92003]
MNTKGQALKKVLPNNMLNKRKGSAPGLSSDKKLAVRLLTPTFILLALLTLFPIGYAVYISLSSFDTFGNHTGFVGLENFIKTLTNGTFWNSIYVTLLFTALAVGSQIFLGFNLALIMSRDSNAMKYLRWLLIIPMMLSPLVVAIVFRLMLNTDMGIINYMLQGLGLQKINFLGEPVLAFLSLVVVDIWQWTPMVFLIILAGMQSLPKDPFEAANIDGASKLQTIRYVMIPMLKPVIVVALVIRTMDALRTFDQVFVLTQGGPGRATETVSFLMYRQAMKFSEFGFASAGLLIVLVITIVISSLLIKLMNSSQAAN